MKSGFRITCIIIMYVAVITGFGCAKKGPPVTESVTQQAAPALTQQEMKKIVVARVNGVELYMDALDRMMTVISANTPTTSSPASREELRKKALDQLVMRELAFQQAKRQDLKVYARDVNHAMDNLVRSLGHDAGFQEFLEREHTTEPEVRAQVEKSLLLRLLFTNEVLKKVNVSDDDIRAYYDDHKGEYLTQGKQMSFEDAKGVIENKLKVAAQAKRIAEWEQDLKKDAVIELPDTTAPQVQRKP
jgi:hypothetical protein